MRAGSAGATTSNPRSTNTYTYATDGWGDRLTSYNGTAITYDSMGNPVSYYNGAGTYTFSWSGRQATTIQKDWLTYNFTYNDEGMRTSKTVNGITTNYYVSGTQILAEETNGNITVYIYDSEGLPLGMQYHGANYAANVWDVFWYERNIFGDVIAVYDETGDLLISYVYDAYGIASVQEHNNGFSTRAYYNPMRYRGYYFDLDLDLYYLSTRYYDCRTGRFVSPDKFVSTGQGLTGYNMYSYCNDNPIMNIDPTGEFPWLILGIIAAFTIGFGILGATSEVKLGEPPKELDSTPEADKSIADEAGEDSTEEELSVGDRVRNTVIGAGAGLALGGAVVATGGVMLGAINGIGAAYLGVSAMQGFAIGTLLYNSAALFIMPLFNIEMEPIEYEAPTDSRVPDVKSLPTNRFR